MLYMCYHTSTYIGHILCDRLWAKLFMLVVLLIISWNRMWMQGWPMSSVQSSGNLALQVDLCPSLLFLFIFVNNILMYSKLHTKIMIQLFFLLKDHGLEFTASATFSYLWKHSFHSHSFLPSSSRNTHTIMHTHSHTDTSSSFLCLYSATVLLVVFSQAPWLTWAQSIPGQIATKYINHIILVITDLS